MTMTKIVRTTVMVIVLVYDPLSMILTSYSFSEEAFDGRFFDVTKIASGEGDIKGTLTWGIKNKDNGRIISSMVLFEY